MLVCGCGRIGFDAQRGDAATDGVVPTMSRCHFRDVSAGRDHTCAIDGVGDVFCWGRTDRGQVVIGQAGYIATPTKITLPRPAVQIEAGRDFSCARLDDDTLYHVAASEMLLPHGQPAGTEVEAISSYLRFR